MSGPHLAAEFSEDAFAKEDRRCQRPVCNALIRRGDPCLYIATVDPSKPGRYVCSSCYAHYLRKLSTTIRARPLPDPQVIRQSVSDAQSSSTLHPLTVVAMANQVVAWSGIKGVPPQAASSSSLARSQAFLMPPPPVPSSQGPQVHVPPHPRSAAQAAGSVYLPAGSIGYGVQHLQYASQRDYWARAAHRPPSAEMISLDIFALYEGGSRKQGARGNQIGNICEGLKDIDALITAPELVSLALETITPRIKAHCPQFPWRVGEFVVRDAKWVNLSMHSPYLPYFYHDCLHQVSRQNSEATVFKTKQFSLYVVVPEGQWNEMDEFQEMYGYDTAEFLVFTQHVQYVNTGSQAYISDYQGSKTLLSDPRILTHPDVNDGQELFGEGNYAKRVAAFEKEHICNKYCKWPGFHLNAFSGGKSSGTA